MCLTADLWWPCSYRVNVELRGADIRAADMVVLIWVFTWLPQVLPGESRGQVREGRRHYHYKPCDVYAAMSLRRTGIFKKINWWQRPTLTYRLWLFSLAHVCLKSFRGRGFRITSHRENKMRSKKSKLKISNPPSIHPFSTSNSLHRLTSQKKKRLHHGLLKFSCVTLVAETEALFLLFRFCGFIFSFFWIL